MLDMEGRSSYRSITYLSMVDKLNIFVFILFFWKLTHAMRGTVSRCGAEAGVYRVSVLRSLFLWLYSSLMRLFYAIPSWILPPVRWRCVAVTVYIRYAIIPTGNG